MKTIEIIDYTGAKPKKAATLTMDAEGLVTCDNANMMEDLKEFGIGSAPQEEDRLVYPENGEAFWKALPFHFSGMLRAVEKQ